MRTPIVAGNWKMYKTVAEAVKYVHELRAMLPDVAGVQVVLAPTFTALHRSPRPRAAVGLPSLHRTSIGNARVHSPAR